MFRLLILNNVPIFEQLRLEEALLRANGDNWCLLNTGSPPAIVMGISGKPEKLLDLKTVAQNKIPVIRRFSGGGTVYVDPHTVFATLICNSSTVDIPLQPKPILKWSEGFYKPLFKDFCLRENDYVFGEKKFAGNAQYIQKGRWLLHTCFLWDCSLEQMNCLLLPEKRPQYRGGRSHADFLCTLRPQYPDKDLLLETLATYAQKTLAAHPASLADTFKILQHPHRSGTTEINILPLTGG
jgi:lipoate---protein ligase